MITWLYAYQRTSHRIERSLADGEFEVVAVARVENFEGGGSGSSSGDSHPGGADGFFLAATTRSGDSGDGDGDVCAADSKRTFGHLAGDGFADGSVLGNVFGGNS